MQFGICCLCQKYADLCDSHAIPDAHFRSFLREGNGSAIAATDDLHTPIVHSSDTWSSAQLCRPCEELLNEEYDSFGIAVFKGKIGTANRTSNGVTFRNIDIGRLRMFLLAVLWRMVASEHQSYFNARLPPKIQEELRLALQQRTKFRNSLLHIAMERLHDSTPEGGFSSEQFRQIVISPFIRKHRRGYAICFLMFGFLVRVFVPSLSIAERRSVSVLNDKAVLFVPLLEFVNFPELFNLGVRSVYKSHIGLSKISDA